VHGRVVHGDRLSFSVVELDADSVVPEHSHEQEQLGIVLTGSLSFRIGEETQDLRPGATWSIPSNTPHEVHVGPEGAVVIDVSRRRATTGVTRRASTNARRAGPRAERPRV
jgi:quercetin dioxygenase-like cupin family protein